MNRFWAFTHVGVTWDFIGDSWEDGGFSVDKDGNPKADGNRNTVSGFDVTPIDPVRDADKLRDSYAGGDSIGSRESFVYWLMNDAGLSAEGAYLVADQFVEEYNSAYAVSKEEWDDGREWWMVKKLKTEEIIGMVFEEEIIGMFFERDHAERFAAILDADETITEAKAALDREEEYRTEQLERHGYDATDDAE